MVWIGVEEFLYKGNVGFLGEMLSKFVKMRLCFQFNSSSVLIQFWCFGTVLVFRP